jgi:hypothetical protein
MLFRNADTSSTITLAKPNRLTADAVAHPVVYSVVSGLAVVLLAFGVLSTISGTAAVICAVVGGLGMTLFDLYLGVADGPGRRWAKAHQ